MAPKAARKADKKHANPQVNALRSTFHPPGGCALGKLLASTPSTTVETSNSPHDDTSARCRALVRQLLEGPCARPLRKGNSQPIVQVKGRVNANGHGAWVFTYDQRISTTCWDEWTVLCRGLLVLFPGRALVAEGLGEAEKVPGARLDGDHHALLRGLCAPTSCHACRIFEPMAKFWEGGDEGGEVSWKEVQTACGQEGPRLVRLEEKVDGNLGILYPQLDEDLCPIPDAEPLLATKGTAYSADIERQTRMLREKYSSCRLSPDVSHAIVEVVDVEMKVCVPYTEADAGMRLITASSGSSWLSQGEVDALAAAWRMPRPASRPFPEGATLQDVQQLAAGYRLMPGALLDEGFVALLECPPVAELIRLKVHTHVWNVVHGWWMDNAASKSKISVSSVMPVLRDQRFAAAGVAAFEPSLMKLRRTAGGECAQNDELVERFRAAVQAAERCLEECLPELDGALQRTARVPSGKELARSLELDLGARLPRAKADAVKAFVQCVRSKVAASVVERLGEALPRLVQQAYGRVTDGLMAGECNSAPGAGREEESNSAPGTSVEEEAELLAALRLPALCALAQKAIDVWASDAEAQLVRDKAGLGGAVLKQGLPGPTPPSQ